MERHHRVTATALQPTIVSGNSSTMKIDSYSFGSIQIDGKDYSTDVILLGGDVKSPWWREAGGHVYAVEDFEDVAGCCARSGCSRHRILRAGQGPRRNDIGSG